MKASVIICFTSSGRAARCVRVHMLVNLILLNSIVKSCYLLSNFDLIP